MQHIQLSDTQIQGITLPRLSLILDDDNVLPLSVNLWLIHIWNTRSSFGYRQEHQENANTSIIGHRKILKQTVRLFRLEPLTDATVEAYTGHIYRFMSWLNNQRKEDPKLPTIHAAHRLSARHINHYINNVLPLKGYTKSTISGYKSAILSLMNFFHSLQWSDNLNLTIYSPTAAKIAANNTKPIPLHYISKSWRSVLLHRCTNQRDRLILRMGYETGLRAMENRGLLLDGHMAAGRKQIGLCALFHQLEKHPERTHFEYMLNGKYSKRGASRQLYFGRELLRTMRTYYESERAAIVANTGKNPDSLFLNNDTRTAGKPISSGHPSRIFSKYAQPLIFFDKTYGYHDLRHSFATELFHAEIERKGSQNDALLEVQIRLGHKSTESTKRYVHSRQTMLAQIDKQLGKQHGGF